MRKRIFSLAIVAMVLAVGTGCATVQRQVVGGQPSLTYTTAMQSAALTPHQVLAEAEAAAAAKGDCTQFTTITRGGTTSIRTGGWNCGGVASMYGFGQYGVPMAAPGYSQGELEAIAARGNSPGVVASMPLPPPGSAQPAGTTTDPALAERVLSMEQSLQAVVNAQAEALASQPAR